VRLLRTTPSLPDPKHNRLFFSSSTAGVAHMRATVMTFTSSLHTVSGGVVLTVATITPDWILLDSRFLQASTWLPRQQRTLAPPTLAAPIRVFNQVQPAQDVQDPYCAEVPVTRICLRLTTIIVEIVQLATVLSPDSLPATRCRTRCCPGSRQTNLGHYHCRCDANTLIRRHLPTGHAGGVSGCGRAPGVNLLRP